MFRGKHVCALCLALCLLLTGCGSLNFTSAPAPAVVSYDGSSLGDRTPSCTANPELAALLRAAVERQEDVTIQGWSMDTITACLDELMVLPEYFWLNGYHISASTGLRTTATVEFRWVYDDGPAKYQQMCAAADEILAWAPAEDDYARALYLYDWLEAHVTYAASEGYDQTAYAAICEGSAVCGGIADAFAFLLQRSGIPACAVTGTAIQDGERTSHAWNYAELDGAVYAFDLTWDNSDRYDASGREYLQHQWFAITSAELNASHTPDDPNDNITAIANADNYYIREGAILTEDSMDAVYAALQPQMAAGANALTFRCADRAVYSAVCMRLFDLGEAAGVLRRLGAVGSGSFNLTYTQQDGLFSVVMYL